MEEGKSDVVKHLVEHGKMDITQFDQVNNTIVRRVMYCDYSYGYVEITS